MQVMDQRKRAKILTAAAELFAAQPFHKVLLSEVAEAAAVGKGTLYVYFKNKEELYLSVLYSGFSALVDRLHEQMAAGSGDPVENLKTIIRETIRFAFQNPHVFELMRTVSGWHPVDRTQWDAKRRELKALIESIIRKGITQGLFIDPHPQLTAHYIPGMVRGALIDGINSVDREMLTAHIVRFVLCAIGTTENV